MKKVPCGQMYLGKAGDFIAQFLGDCKVPMGTPSYHDTLCRSAGQGPFCKYLREPVFLRMHGAHCFPESLFLLLAVMPTQ